MSRPDVVVVGGGIVGLATAWHLVRGGARTLLFDADEPGRASDAGAGILATAQAINHPDPRQRFVARAARDYPEMIEALDAAGAGPTGYAVVGRLAVAVDEDEAATFRQMRDAIEGGARPPFDSREVIDGAAARRMFPPLADVPSAIHDPRGARVDGRLISGALRRSAIDAGLTVRRTPADSLLLDGAEVIGITAGGDEILAGGVVLAAGAWSRALAGTAGVDLPVEPQRGQIIHLEVAGETTGWPIVTAFRDHYMLAWDDRRVVAGATREMGSGFDLRTSAAGIMEVLGEALRVAPGLARASLREIRVGLRPASPDGQPILGAIPGRERLYLATGHGPKGLQLGPYSGRAVAGLILTGEAPSDLAPFTLARFT